MPELQPLPPLDLGDLQTVAAHRDALAQQLPDMLTGVGLSERADMLERGRYGEVEEWFRKAVSVGRHGIDAGGLNLTVPQMRVFTPNARYHGLIAPTAELWQPGDDLPEGVGPGEIKDYQVAPDFENLPPAVFHRKTTKVVAGATFSGLIGRISSGVEIIERSPDQTNAPHELVVLTGMRQTEASEGNNGLYKQYLDVAPGLEAPPIEQVFPAESDSALAILRAQFKPGTFRQVAEVLDPQRDRKPEDRIHPKLGSREWIARGYEGTLPSGKHVRVTVVNGEPIKPAEDAMNRSTKVPAPLATETFKDWLKLLPQDRALNICLCISFAHLARISSELRVAASREGLARQLGSVTLAGNMPQPAVYNLVDVNGFHNGGTMGFKELFPLLQAYNIILGRDPGDFSPN